MGFLENLSSAVNIGGDIASMAKLLGLGKDRPSWRDMQFMMDANERLAPRDIALQGQYLEGLAPAQAGAYNTYQDATYGQDTARQTSRIQEMASGLGMSPWEITGSSGAAPLPSPSFGGSNQGASKQEYMAQLVPLQIAKMNNETALATTAMQTMQQKYATDKTTGASIYGTDTAAATTRYTVDQTQGLSPKAKAEIEEIQSRIDLQVWQKANSIQDLDIKQQNMLLSIMRIALDASPKDTYSIPGLTTTQPAIWKQIFGVLKNENSDQLGWERAGADLLAKLPPDEFNDLKRWALGNAKNIGNDIDAFFGGARKWLGGEAPGQMADEFGQFLQGLISQAQDAGMPKETLDKRIPR